jgi:hypothetical protein
VRAAGCLQSITNAAACFQTVSHILGKAKLLLILFKQKEIPHILLIELSSIMAQRAGAQHAAGFFIKPPVGG